MVGGNLQNADPTRREAIATEMLNSTKDQKKPLLRVVRGCTNGIAPAENSSSDFSLLPISEISTVRR